MLAQSHIPQIRLAPDGIEQFVATPELQGQEGIGTDPLPPGQVWAISPGGQDEAAGLYRIESNEGPGSGVRIANVQPPPPFRESVTLARENLYARAGELVGDREPRHHELTVQLRAMDAVRSGAGLGLPTLLSFCSVLLGKSLRGGLVAAGGLNLGGGLEPIHNAVQVAELAVERGADLLLLPIGARRQLIDLSDDMAAKVQIVFYTDARDALMKALMD